ncbi:uncharacterized protein LOC142223154 isoform X4 [Haematobia irritans]
MEQWVSDTFYSYFPGFNNEYQRNNYRHSTLNQKTLNSSSSSKDQTISEDIKMQEYTKVRPGSARYKLLKDLQHTNLSNDATLNKDDTLDLERKNKSARKKEYQEELIQQIEEKRRSIELLKEKEREQERILTRRLQEQLKTIKLEEQLEMERIKASEFRFKAEQNRHMRKHILTKLENDSKLLEADRKIDKENVRNWNENNVYKYFSNSAKTSLTSPRDELGQSDFFRKEMECFHLSEKICPICDNPLKELRHFCLRCQSIITFPTHISDDEDIATKQQKINIHEFNGSCDAGGCEKSFRRERGSKVFACNKCDRVYDICPQCLKKDDFCSACSIKKKVCMHCRTNLCSFCLGELAVGKNAENHHINEKSNSITEPMFQISANDGADAVGAGTSMPTISENNLSGCYEENSSNHLNAGSRISQQETAHFFTNNIVGPDLISIHQKNSKNALGNIDVMDNFIENDMKKLRQSTDLRLLNYFKNYKDLAHLSHAREYGTTGFGSEKLSIPILCEMPKMIRKGNSKPNKHFSNLKQRWDVPAVQSITISPSSPKVVTQLGAIRKQLQANTLFFDDTD